MADHDRDDSFYDRRAAYLQHKLAERAVVAAEQIAHELIQRKGSSSLQIILVRAKKEAAEGLAGLINVDPHDTAAIIGFQIKVQKFQDMVRFLADAISAGDSSRYELDEADKADVAELVTEFGGEDGV